MSTKILFAEFAFLGLLLGGCDQQKQESPTLPILTELAILNEIDPTSSNAPEDVSNNDLDPLEENLIQLAVADLSNRPMWPDRGFMPGFVIAKSTDPWRLTKILVERLF